MIDKPETMMKIIENGVKRFPDRTVIVCGDRPLTWKEFDEVSDIVAANLLKQGIRRGDKIGLNAPNLPEWLIAFFALAKIGAVAVALNVRFRQAELEYMLNHSEAVGLISIGPLKSAFGDFDFVEYIKGLRGKFRGVKQYYFIGAENTGDFSEAQPFKELLGSPSTEDKKALAEAKAQVQPGDPLIIIYTSGTTGKPKGAVITQKSLIACAHGQVLQTEMNENDSMVVALPLNHVAGLTCAVLSLLVAGGRVILQPVFIPSEHLALCDKHKPSIFGGVTTMLIYAFKDPSFRPEMVASARLTMAGGSNVEPELMEQMIKYLPQSKTFNLYGLSECSGGVVMSTLEDTREILLNSIGKPIPGHKVTVVDEKLNPLPAGEIGEIMITGEAMAAGYYNQPEATKNTFLPQGLLTGDMGYMDEVGYVYLKGRKKEMYIQGGYNIYPAEIENVLTQHPMVALAAGIGVPDPDLGEIGRYYIVKAGADGLDEKELSTYLKERLANYKIPKQFVFVDELPLTPSGKVAKIQLKQQLAQEG